MARTCIYCAAETTMTGEHVFPNWINDLYPAAEVGETEVFNRLIAFGEPTVDRAYSKKDVASLRTKFVCASCNNGWMSALEDEARMVLIPLAKGERRTLSLHSQLVVATWAVKTFQIYETIWRRPPLSSAADRTTVMRERRPSARSRVWALAYDGTIGPLRATYLVAEVSEPGRPAMGRAYLATFQLGCLVLQVAGADNGIETGGGLATVGERTPRRLQLFPPLPTLQWPPTEVLNDSCFIEATTETSIIDRRIPVVSVPGLHDLPGR